MRKLMIIFGLLAMSASAFARTDVIVSPGVNIAPSPSIGVTVHRDNHRYNNRHRHGHGRHYCRVSDPRGRIWVVRGRNACARAIAECRDYHVRRNYHDYRGGRGGRCFVVR